MKRILEPVAFMAGVLGMIAVAVLIICLVAASIVYAVNYPACRKYGELTGKQTFFSLGTDCLVLHEGRWLNYDVVVGKKQEITIREAK